jgi:hypothetical protein
LLHKLLNYGPVNLTYAAAGVAGGLISAFSIYEKY